VSRSLAQSPRLVDSPFWQGIAFRRDHYHEIVDQALARTAMEHDNNDPTAARRIILDGALGGTGEAGASPVPGGDFISRLDRAEQLESEGKEARAAAILKAAVRERPDDPAARLALGRLDAAEGDMRGARAQWLAGAYLGDTASILSLGDSFAPGQVPAPIQDLGAWSVQNLWLRQFSITSQHYRFAFRRQEPWPIILPGDWLNGLPRVYSEMDTALRHWGSRTGGARPDRQDPP